MADLCRVTIDARRLSYLTVAYRSVSQRMYGYMSSRRTKACVDSRLRSPFIPSLEVVFSRFCQWSVRQLQRTADVVVSTTDN